MKQKVIFVVIVILLAVGPVLRAQSTQPATQPANDQAVLEQQFAMTLGNALLVGRFTTDGQEQDPKEDRYTIGRVQKLAGDRWLINAHIGAHDVTLPLVIPVKWAGDTPVISISDWTLPGFGSYTARVMIYADHYAGTWSAGRGHGGLLFGRIEHAAGTTSQPAK